MIFRVLCYTSFVILLYEKGKPTVRLGRKTMGLHRRMPGYRISGSYKKTQIPDGHSVLGLFFCSCKNGSKIMLFSFDEECSCNGAESKSSYGAWQKSNSTNYAFCTMHFIFLTIDNLNAHMFNKPNVLKYFCYL